MMLNISDLQHYIQALHVPILVTGASGFVGAIANKLTVLTIRLFSLNWRILWRLPLGLFVGLIATLFIIFAHFTNSFDMGSKQDPLGYFVQAKRRYLRQNFPILVMPRVKSPNSCSWHYLI